MPALITDEGWWHELDDCNTESCEAESFAEFFDVDTASQGHSFFGDIPLPMPDGIEVTRPPIRTKETSLKGKQPISHHADEPTRNFDMAMDIDFDDPMIQSLINEMHSKSVATILDKINENRKETTISSKRSIPVQQQKTTGQASLDTGMKVLKSIPAKPTSDKRTSKRKYDDYVQTFRFQDKQGVSQKKIKEIEPEVPVAISKAKATSVWKLPGRVTSARPKTEQEKAHKKAMTGISCVGCIWDKKKCDMLDICTRCAKLLQSYVQHLEDEGEVASPWQKIDICFRANLVTHWLDGRWVDYYGIFRCFDLFLDMTAKATRGFVYNEPTTLMKEQAKESTKLMDTIACVHSDSLAEKVRKTINDLAPAVTAWVRSRGTSKELEEGVGKEIELAYSLVEWLFMILKHIQSSYKTLMRFRRIIYLAKIESKPHLQPEAAVTSRLVVNKLRFVEDHHNLLFDVLFSWTMGFLEELERLERFYNEKTSSKTKLSRSWEYPVIVEGRNLSLPDSESMIGSEDVYPPCAEDGAGHETDLAGLNMHLDAYVYSITKILD